MKQLASDIERRMPEPCSPVTRTRQAPLASWYRMPRWNSVRPGAFLSARVQGTLKVGNAAHRVAAR